MINDNYSFVKVWYSFTNANISNEHWCFCNFSSSNIELSIDERGKRGKWKLNHALTNVHASVGYIKKKLEYIIMRELYALKVAGI